MCGRYDDLEGNYDKTREGKKEKEILKKENVKQRNGEDGVVPESFFFLHGRKEARDGRREEGGGKRLREREQEGSRAAVREGTKVTKRELFLGKEL